MSTLPIVERLRRDEVQAIGAALSLRDWHKLEQAYNALRDKMDHHIALTKARSA